MVVRNGARLNSNFTFTAEHNGSRNIEGEENSVLRALTNTSLENKHRSEVEKIDNRDEFAVLFETMADIIEGVRGAILKSRSTQKPCKSADVLRRFAGALQAQTDMEMKVRAASETRKFERRNVSSAFEFLNSPKGIKNSEQTTSVSDALSKRSQLLNSFSVADKLLAKKSESSEKTKTKDNEGRTM